MSTWQGCPQISSMRQPLWIANTVWNAAEIRMCNLLNVKPCVFSLCQQCKSGDGTMGLNYNDLLRKWEGHKFYSGSHRPFKVDNILTFVVTVIFHFFPAKQLADVECWRTIRPWWNSATSTTGSNIKTNYISAAKLRTTFPARNGELVDHWQLAIHTDRFKIVFSWSSFCVSDSTLIILFWTAAPHVLQS